MKSDILKRVGLWGHPWHGLVKSGTLTLPNGAQMAYPQPDGGDTNLLSVPGVPPVQRSPEAQLEDAAAGRQWWTSATLAGRQSQLYSKPLGQGAWIYVDPAGVRWLVETTLHTNAQYIQNNPQAVMLTRFGEFYGAPEVHVYPLPALNVEQSGPPVASSAGSPLEVGMILCRLFSTHPQGAAAAFVLTADYTSTSRINPLRPVGWLELTLSGLGGACSASLSVMHSRAQTIGEVTDSMPVGDRVQWTLEESWTVTTEGGATPPDCSGLQTITSAFVPRLKLADEGPNVHDFSQYSPVNADYTRSVVGWVYAVWYDAGGARRDLLFDALEHGLWSVPELLLEFVPHIVSTPFVYVPGGDSCGLGTGVVQSRWSVRMAADAHHEVTYRLVLRDSDGEYAALDVSRVADYGVEYGVAEGPSGGRQLQSRRRYGTETLIYTGAVEPQVITKTWDQTEYEKPTLEGLLRYVSPATSPLDAKLVRTGFDRVRGAGFFEGPFGDERYLHAAPIAYSNNAVGVMRGIRLRTDPSYSFLHFGRLATPLGAVECPPLFYSTPAGSVTGSTVPAASVHASWCPVTQQVAMSTERVCWV